MFKNIKRLYCKFLVLLFYILGDFASKFNFYWTATLYQKFMSSSLHYDEKINFWLWKEPSLNKETDL